MTPPPERPGATRRPPAPNRQSTGRPAASRQAAGRSTSTSSTGAPQARRSAPPRPGTARSAGPRTGPAAQTGRPGVGAPRTAARRPAGRPPVRRTRPLGQPGHRLRWGLVMIGLVVLLLGGRLVQLQGIAPVALADRSGIQNARTVTVPAERGRLLDRKGNELAVSVQATNITANPRALAKAVCQPGATEPCDAASVARVIAPLLGLPASEVEAKLRLDKGFVYLKRGMEPAAATKVLALALPGISSERTSRRVHPSHDLAAGVLGFTDFDGRGAAGVEQALQSVLAGKDGKTVARFDALGRIIPTGADRRVDPVAGKDIELTLDRDVQWYAQKLLADQVRATGARNGSVVVLDVKTGQVLALASAPTFDPDNRTSGALMNNPALSDVYEPGSVFKVVTAAAALTDGIVTPNTVIEVPPTYQVSNKVLHDAEKHGLEHLTFAGVLAKSSNIGTVKVAQQLGAQRLYDQMKLFGFGSSTDLGLPGESRGRIPAPADWSGTSIANIPIGQGVSVTVMQVASLYATLANDGIKVDPTLIRSIRDNAGHVTAGPAGKRVRIVTPQVAASIRLILEQAASEQGTAPLAQIPGYRVAGKTGTAQRVAVEGPRKGRYDGSYTSSFVGMAPADAPRFVTAVVLQGTGARGYFGGQVAAPLFSKITGFALRAYGVPPTGAARPVLRLSADAPR